MLKTKKNPKKTTKKPSVDKVVEPVKVAEPTKAVESTVLVETKWFFRGEKELSEKYILKMKSKYKTDNKVAITTVYEGHTGQTGVTVIKVN